MLRTGLSILLCILFFPLWQLPKTLKKATFLPSGARKRSSQDIMSRTKRILQKPRY